MKACFIIVRGDVHGVFYRHYTKKSATGYNINGWCLNQDDGTVKIFAQGAEEDIKKFIEWTKEGSPMSSVSDVIVRDAKPDETLRGFEIR